MIEKTMGGEGKVAEWLIMLELLRFRRRGGRLDRVLTGPKNRGCGNRRFIYNVCSGLEREPTKGIR
jgi:hypothetical protein